MPELGGTGSLFNDSAGHQKTVGLNLPHSMLKKIDSVLNKDKMT